MRVQQEWSAGEIDVLARAVVQAPSVHNTQPWRLELPPGEARLSERADLVLPHHDPAGVDRAISCGAAVANLELAMRVLGRMPEVRLLPHPSRPEIVADLIAADVRPPSDVDLHRYSAIARRRSYRSTFTSRHVAHRDIEDLVRVSDDDGEKAVWATVLRHHRDLLALADVLEYAAAALRQDRGYQRELMLWTVGDPPRNGVGIARAALTNSTLPWAGLVRPGTAVPDREVLAARLERETVLVFCTPGDTRLDHLRTGIAVQRVWLTAVDLGLAAAVQTQPLHLPEARDDIRDTLRLDGCPQLLLRVGYPAGTTPPSPRRNLGELFRDE